MKLNRITSLAAVVVAVLIVVGQFVGGAKAAPPAQPAAHFQANGITAQMNPPAQSAGKQNPSKGTTARPADQSPLDFTVQGRLTDHSGNPITSPTAVVFSLYSVASGGTALLTQSATVTPDLNGLFTYIFIVDTTSNFNNLQLFDSKLYLGIKVGSDTEMTPRFELTASPYAMSLAPGAQITGNFDYGTNNDNGLLNLYNTNTTSIYSAGLYSSGSIGVWGASNDNSTSEKAGVYATGATAVWGVASSSGSSNGYGGFFFNNGGGSGTQDGVYAYTTHGYGVYAYSHFAAVSQPAWSIFATDGTEPASINYVKTGITAYRNDAAGSIGILSWGPAASGYGVVGSAYNNFHNTNGNSTATGVYAEDYDLSTSATGLYVQGSGHSTGGFFTPQGFGMVVRYNGSTDLYPGDVLALDGNNGTLNGDTLVGVVKADGGNMGAAIGVAQYRITTTTEPLAVGTTSGPTQQVTHVDNIAKVIKPGELVQIVTSGQAKVKVSGNVNIGDRLAVGSDGSVATTKDSANSIGKVASKPDSNGMVTVVVNFK